MRIAEPLRDTARQTKLITVSAYAALSGVGRATVYRWIRAGGHLPPPALRIHNEPGQRIRIEVTA